MGSCLRGEKRVPHVSRAPPLRARAPPESSGTEQRRRWYAAVEGAGAVGVLAGRLRGLLGLQLGTRTVDIALIAADEAPEQ